MVRKKKGKVTRYEFGPADEEGFELIKGQCDKCGWFTRAIGGINESPFVFVQCVNPRCDRGMEQTWWDLTTSMLWGKVKMEWENENRRTQG
jgi:hypothetical protein